MLETKDPTYYVWYIGTGYVLVELKSASVAQALIEGIHNTEVAIIYPSFKGATKDFSDAEVEVYKTFILTKGPTRADAPTDPKTIQLMELAQLRASKLTELELMIDRYMMRWTNTYDADLFGYLGPAFEKGPDHPLMHTYALIQNIDNIAAYDDLKMRYDSYAMVKIKAFGCFEKYKRIINENFTGDQMNDALGQCQDDLFGQTRI